MPAAKNNRYKEKRDILLIAVARSCLIDLLPVLRSVFFLIEFSVHGDRRRKWAGIVCAAGARMTTGSSRVDCDVASCDDVAPP